MILRAFLFIPHLSYRFGSSASQVNMGDFRSFNSEYRQAV
jgi:hypothetical protein